MWYKIVHGVKRLKKIFKKSSTLQKKSDPKTLNINTWCLISAHWQRWEVRRVSLGRQKEGEKGKVSKRK